MAHAAGRTNGTKPRPTLAPSSDGLNWTALAKCESGGNPHAVNPAGYYGLYQFAMSSWQSVGGQGDPRNSSVDEQTYRAKLLYKAAGGDSPWPTCGHYLYEH